TNMARVVITDHPWPDVDIERDILEAAGHRLIAGPQATPPAAFVEALVREHDPAAIMTCWAQVSAEAIGAPSDLRIVVRMGGGLDNSAVPAAAQRGAWVTDGPDYCYEEVSDHAVALLLDLWRNVTAMDRDVKRGAWRPGAARARRVAEMTVGLVGYGRIGRATARKLRGFGCRLLVNSPSLLRDKAEGDGGAPGVSVASRGVMQRECDAIVILAPLTAATHHMIDDRFIAALRRKPLLINVSRGAIVENEALVRGLDAGLIAG